jgi:hypothetical protein
MSHWYRLPRPLSVKEFLLCAGRACELDESMSVHLQLFKDYLPSVTFLLDDWAGHDGLTIGESSKNTNILATTRAISLAEFKRQKEQRRALLLFPTDKNQQLETILHLLEGKLKFHPPVKRTAVLERSRNNAFCLDLRMNPPLMSLGGFTAAQNPHTRAAAGI